LGHVFYGTRVVANFLLLCQHVTWVGFRASFNDAIELDDLKNPHLDARNQDYTYRIHVIGIMVVQVEVRETRAMSPLLPTASTLAPYFNDYFCSSIRAVVVIHEHIDYASIRRPL